MPASVPITVLISGNGTNLQALIDACASGSLPARIVRVISNRKAAYGLHRASSAGIPTAYHNLVEYKRKHGEGSIDQAREAYDADLASLVLADSPALVVCAGFMHILKPAFLEPLRAAGVPVINLHPALPGQFEGANAIERAHREWKAGKIGETGVMVHYVIEKVDAGEVICSERIPFVEGGDDELEKLQERFHEVEHGIIVKGTRMAIERLQEKEAGGKQP
ncbi:phosphoribosylglycinamide formyltransferase [Lineolata rhizophorae]|uniref:Phosphoribosylglycinamide formyltransferase n=1 Tax=Lineolata rhizophorae TaxID=578093 RepID=A0A6A6NZJ0_9PEZI|nr:phosphoribosylglycinamide formyltransferase [Lineolata rhizophorae]